MAWKIVSYDSDILIFKFLVSSAIVAVNRERKSGFAAIDYYYHLDFGRNFEIKNTSPR